MIDPIFAAPRRQEGFASEKQKLLEDCRRRLSKMATFFKRWTGCVLFLQNHCRQQIHDQQSELLTQVKARENRVTSAYPICWVVCWDLHQPQLPGEAVGSGPNVKLQYTMELSKSCWLHFFSLNCTGWCQVSAQMSKCQRKSEVELEQLDICFSFPVDSWLNGFENTASMNKLREAFSSSRPHSLCSHQMPSLWRRRLALISAQERSAQEALQHRQQIQQQVNELGPGLCCYDQGPGQFGRNCRAQNDVIHLRKV